MNIPCANIVRTDFMIYFCSLDQDKSKIACKMSINSRWRRHSRWPPKKNIPLLTQICSKSIGTLRTNSIIYIMNIMEKLFLNKSKMADKLIMAWLSSVLYFASQSTLHRFLKTKLFWVNKYHGLERFTCWTSRKSKTAEKFKRAEWTSEIRFFFSSFVIIYYIY
jgi:hypothetical protein